MYLKRNSLSYFMQWTDVFRFAPFGFFVVFLGDSTRNKSSDARNTSNSGSADASPGPPLDGIPGILGQFPTGVPG